MASPVDDYLQTPGPWRDEMQALRPVLLDSGLDEALKWAKPCYAHAGENIAIMQPMKDFLALMFFKGALVDDPDGILREQGPNSRAAKRLEFTGVEAIRAAEPQLRALVASAIAVEASGAKLPPGGELELPEELTEALNQAIKDQMENGKTTLIEAMINQELGEPFRRDAMKKPVQVAGIDKNDMKPQKV